jgi:hypothetical protein
MIGRPAKPTVFKRLHGSDQPRNPREPKPSGEPVCPADFDDVRRAIWDEAISSSPPGLLKQCDSVLIETWVNAIHLQRKAMAELAEEPLSGPLAKRLLTTIARAGSAAIRVAGELGFSPASRSRVQVGPVGRNPAPTQESDRPRLSLEEYLASAPKPH